jgi:hypothetical protein
MRKFEVTYKANGRYRTAMVELENNTITVEQCKKIVEDLSKKENEEVKEITVDLSTYTNYDENGIRCLCEDGDYENFTNEIIGEEKTAKFIITKEYGYALRIYEFDTLVYGNVNGKKFYSEEQ